jgi:hypothetical protein
MKHDFPRLENELLKNGIIGNFGSPADESASLNFRPLGFVDKIRDEDQLFERG